MSEFVSSPWDETIPEEPDDCPDPTGWGEIICNL